MDSKEVSLTIELTDEMIDRAIARVLTRRGWDDDACEEYEHTTIDIDAIVKKRVGQQVDDAIAKASAEQARVIVTERVNKALDEGFPVFTSYGERNGTKSTLKL